MAKIFLHLIGYHAFSLVNIANCFSSIYQPCGNILKESWKRIYQCSRSAPAGIGVVNEIFIFLKKREITATIMTTSELDKRFSFFRQPKKSGGEQMN